MDKWSNPKIISIWKSSLEKSNDGAMAFSLSGIANLEIIGGEP